MTSFPYPLSSHATNSLGGCRVEQGRPLLFTKRAPPGRYTDVTVKRAFTPSGHKRAGSTLDRDTTGIQCQTGQGLHSSTNQATVRTQLPIGA